MIKKIVIFFFCILSAFCLSIGFPVAATDKIPNFGFMKENYTKQSYFVVNISGKSKTFKMTDIETIMIARLFNSNNYTDTYTDNRFNPKVSSPYIEIRIKPNRMIHLFYAGNGFVFLDQKKQYYVDQNRFSDFFNYCQKKYSSANMKNFLPATKYRPSSFRSKDFLGSLKKAGCNYKSLRTQWADDLKVPVEVVSLLYEEISIYEFKDNIDMELGAIHFNVMLNSMDFVRMPHYYKRGNLVVTYYGDNDQIIKSIEKVMGEQSEMK